MKKSKNYKLTKITAVTREDKVKALEVLEEYKKGIELVKEYINEDLEVPAGGPSFVYNIIISFGWKRN